MGKAEGWGRHTNIEQLWSQLIQSARLSPKEK